MPLQVNVAIQNQPRVVWDGATARAVDIRKHTRFAFSFEVTAAIATAAVFNIEAAMPSAADPCVPDAFSPVPEVATCDATAVAGPQATVTIPAGTVVGTICTGTIACRSGAFIRLASAGGDTANVLGAMVLTGPKI